MGFDSQEGDTKGLYSLHPFNNVFVNLSEICT